MELFQIPEEELNELAKLAHDPVAVKEAVRAREQLEREGVEHPK